MADKTDEENLSTQYTLNSCHDPGWNDPPKWALSPNTLSSTKNTPTKRLLNKRVAFPLSSSPSSTVSTSSSLQKTSMNLPPPPSILTPLTTAPHAPLVTPTTVMVQNNSESSSSPSIINKDQTLLKTMENLEYILNTELVDNCHVDDIKKRLEIMKNLWNEEKFNNDIINKIFLISQELKLKNIEKADEIHISLMVDYAAICTNGVSGIRHLIFELRKIYSNNQINNHDNEQKILLFNPLSNN
ncbi:hypothetical protein HCN44_011435 [Aphidius gifuensis]|uniref:SRA1/Sec31 domain-containing protein n=1 Tax=Aphidius gifuensis TaxID=684658 RepID=A0A834XWP3_APHGI|nr:steroid receptor RNA activator 1-like [Aphidius gifuensis]KAF7994166.1 hypothetical protein HCN44_011435 [Aphidius gifuensis]